VNDIVRAVVKIIRATKLGEEGPSFAAGLIDQRPFLPRVLAAEARVKDAELLSQQLGKDIPSSFSGRSTGGEGETKKLSVVEQRTMKYRRTMLKHRLATPRSRPLSVSVPHRAEDVEAALDPLGSAYMMTSLLPRGPFFVKRWDGSRGLFSVGWSTPFGAIGTRIPWFHIGHTWVQSAPKSFKEAVAGGDKHSDVRSVFAGHGHPVIALLRAWRPVGHAGGDDQASGGAAADEAAFSKVVDEDVAYSRQVAAAIAHVARIKGGGHEEASTTDTARTHVSEALDDVIAGRFDALLHWIERQPVSLEVGASARWLGVAAPHDDSAETLAPIMEDPSSVPSWSMALRSKNVAVSSPDKHVMTPLSLSASSITPTAVSSAATPESSSGALADDAEEKAAMSAVATILRPGTSTPHVLSPEQVTELENLLADETNQVATEREKRWWACLSCSFSQLATWGTKAPSLALDLARRLGTLTEDGTAAGTTSLVDAVKALLPASQEAALEQLRGLSLPLRSRVFFRVPATGQTVMHSACAALDISALRGSISALWPHALVSHPGWPIESFLASADPASSPSFSSVGIAALTGGPHSHLSCAIRLVCALVAVDLKGFNPLQRATQALVTAVRRRSDPLLAARVFRRVFALVAEALARANSVIQAAVEALSPGSDFPVARQAHIRSTVLESGACSSIARGGRPADLSVYPFQTGRINPSAVLHSLRHSIALSLCVDRSISSDRGPSTCIGALAALHSTREVSSNAELRREVDLVLDGAWSVLHEWLEYTQHEEGADSASRREFIIQWVLHCARQDLTFRGDLLSSMSRLDLPRVRALLVPAWETPPLDHDKRFHSHAACALHSGARLSRNGLFLFAWLASGAEMIASVRAGSRSLWHIAAEALRDSPPSDEQEVALMLQSVSERIASSPSTLSEAASSIADLESLANHCLSMLLDVWAEDAQGHRPIATALSNAVPHLVGAILHAATRKDHPKFEAAYRSADQRVAAMLCDADRHGRSPLLQAMLLNRSSRPMGLVCSLALFATGNKHSFESASTVVSPRSPIDWALKIFPSTTVFAERVVSAMAVWDADHLAEELRAADVWTAVTLPDKFGITALSLCAEFATMGHPDVASCVAFVATCALLECRPRASALSTGIADSLQRRHRALEPAPPSKKLFRGQPAFHHHDAGALEHASPDLFQAQSDILVEGWLLTALDRLAATSDTALSEGWKELVSFLIRNGCARWGARQQLRLSDVMLSGSVAPPPESISADRVEALLTDVESNHPALRWRCASVSSKLHACGPPCGFEGFDPQVLPRKGANLGHFPLSMEAVDSLLLCQESLLPAALQTLGGPSAAPAQLELQRWLITELESQGIGVFAPVIDCTGATRVARGPVSLLAHRCWALFQGNWASLSRDDVPQRLLLDVVSSHLPPGVKEGLVLDGWIDAGRMSARASSDSTFPDPFPQLLDPKTARSPLPPLVAAISSALSITAQLCSSDEVDSALSLLTEVLIARGASPLQPASVGWTCLRARRRNDLHFIAPDCQDVFRATFSLCAPFPIHKESATRQFEVDKIEAASTMKLNEHLWGAYLMALSGCRHTLPGSDMPLEVLETHSSIAQQSLLIGCNALQFAATASRLFPGLCRSLATGILAAPSSSSKKPSGPAPSLFIAATLGDAESASLFSRVERHLDPSKFASSVHCRVAVVADTASSTPQNCLTITPLRLLLRALCSSVAPFRWVVTDKRALGSTTAPSAGLQSCRILTRRRMRQYVYPLLAALQHAKGSLMSLEAALSAQSVHSTGPLRSAAWMLWPWLDGNAIAIAGRLGLGVVVRDMIANGAFSSPAHTQSLVRFLLPAAAWRGNVESSEPDVDEDKATQTSIVSEDILQAVLFRDIALSMAVSSAALVNETQPVWGTVSEECCSSAAAAPPHSWLRECSYDMREVGVPTSEAEMLGFDADKLALASADATVNCTTALLAMAGASVGSLPFGEHSVEWRAKASPGEEESTRDFAQRVQLRMGLLDPSGSPLRGVNECEGRDDTLSQTAVFLLGKHGVGAGEDTACSSGISLWPLGRDSAELWPWVTDADRRSWMRENLLPVGYGLSINLHSVASDALSNGWLHTMSAALAVVEATKVLNLSQPESGLSFSTLAMLLTPANSDLTRPRPEFLDGAAAPWTLLHRSCIAQDTCASCNWSPVFVGGEPSPPAISLVMGTLSAPDTASDPALCAAQSIVVDPAARPVMLALSPALCWALLARDAVAAALASLVQIRAIPAVSKRFESVAGARAMCILAAHELTVDAPDSTGLTALSYAAATGNHTIAPSLVCIGADPDGRTTGTWQTAILRARLTSTTAPNCCVPAHPMVGALVQAQRSAVCKGSLSFSSEIGFVFRTLLDVPSAFFRIRGLSKPRLPIEDYFSSEFCGSDEDRAMCGNAWCLVGMLIQAGASVSNTAAWADHVQTLVEDGSPDSAVSNAAFHSTAALLLMTSPLLAAVSNATAGYASADAAVAFAAASSWQEDIFGGTALPKGAHAAVLACIASTPSYSMSFEHSPASIFPPRSIGISRDPPEEHEVPLALWIRRKASSTVQRIPLSTVPSGQFDPETYTVSKRLSADDAVHWLLQHSPVGQAAVLHARNWPVRAAELGFHGAKYARRSAILLVLLRRGLWRSAELVAGACGEHSGVGLVRVVPPVCGTCDRRHRQSAVELAAIHNAWKVLARLLSEPEHDVMHLVPDDMRPTVQGLAAVDPSARWRPPTVALEGRTEDFGGEIAVSDSEDGVKCRFLWQQEWCFPLQDAPWHSGADAGEAPAGAPPAATDLIRRWCERASVPLPNALWLAARHGQADALSVLIKRCEELHGGLDRVGGRDGTQVLTGAACAGAEPVTGWTIVEAAVASRSKACLRLVLQHAIPTLPTSLAVGARPPQLSVFGAVATSTLPRHVPRTDTDKQCESPLTVALRIGDLTAANLLVEHGATLISPLVRAIAEEVPAAVSDVSTDSPDGMHPGSTATAHVEPLVWLDRLGDPILCALQHDDPELTIAVLSHAWQLALAMLPVSSRKLLGEPPASWRSAAGHSLLWSFLAAVGRRALVRALLRARVSGELSVTSEDTEEASVFLWAVRSVIRHASLHGSVDSALCAPPIATSTLDDEQTRSAFGDLDEEEGLLQARPPSLICNSEEFAYGATSRSVALAAAMFHSQSSTSDGGRASLDLAKEGLPTDIARIAEARAPRASETAVILAHAIPGSGLLLLLRNFPELLSLASSHLVTVAATSLAERGLISLARAIAMRRVAPPPVMEATWVEKPTGLHPLGIHVNPAAEQMWLALMDASWAAAVPVSFHQLPGLRLDKNTKDAIGRAVDDLPVLATGSTDGSVAALHQARLASIRAGKLFENGEIVRAVAESRATASTIATAAPAIPTGALEFADTDVWSGAWHGVVRLDPADLELVPLEDSSVAQQTAWVARTLQTRLSTFKSSTVLTGQDADSHSEKCLWFTGALNPDFLSTKPAGFGPQRVGEARAKLATLQAGRSSFLTTAPKLFQGLNTSGTELRKAWYNSILLPSRRGGRQSQSVVSNALFVLEAEDLGHEQLSRETPAIAAASVAILRAGPEMAPDMLAASDAWSLLDVAVTSRAPELVRVVLACAEQWIDRSVRFVDPASSSLAASTTLTAASALKAPDAPVDPLIRALSQWAEGGGRQVVSLVAAAMKATCSALAICERVPTSSLVLGDQQDVSQVMQSALESEEIVAGAGAEDFDVPEPSVREPLSAVEALLKGGDDRVFSRRLEPILQAENAIAKAAADALASQPSVTAPRMRAMVAGQAIAAAADETVASARVSEFRASTTRRDVMLETPRTSVSDHPAPSAFSLLHMRGPLKVGVCAAVVARSCARLVCRVAKRAEAILRTCRVLLHKDKGGLAPEMETKASVASIAASSVRVYVEAWAMAIAHAASRRAAAGTLLDGGASGAGGVLAVLASEGLLPRPRASVGRSLVADVVASAAVSVAAETCGALVGDDRDHSIAANSVAWTPDHLLPLIEATNAAVNILGSSSYDDTCANVVAASTVTEAEVRGPAPYDVEALAVGGATYVRSVLHPLQATMYLPLAPSAKEGVDDVAGGDDAATEAGDDLPKLPPMPLEGEASATAEEATPLLLACFGIQALGATVEHSPEEAQRVVSASRLILRGRTAQIHEKNCLELGRAVVLAMSARLSAMIGDPGLAGTPLLPKAI
jgi:hypothetical protein